jgi:hypothetical protein
MPHSTAVEPNHRAGNALRIAIDPILAGEAGPEIAWTWRLLLTDIGIAWREIPFDSPDCDIVYAARGRTGPDFRLRIEGDVGRWRRRFELRLDGVVPTATPPLAFVGDAGNHGRVRQARDRVLWEHDAVFDAFRLSSGIAERGLDRNRHGHLELPPGSPERSVLHTAPVSANAATLAEVLLQQGVDPGLPRWPHGRRAAACLTHDVDYPEVIRWLEPFRVVGRRGRSGLRPAIDVLRGRRTHWHFHSWLDLEHRHGFTSSFHFVPRQGSLREYAFGTPDPFYAVESPAFRRLFRFLRAEDAEIALHSSYHSHEAADRMAHERTALERASDGIVVGNRHHYLHVDPAAPERTLLLHEQVGLQYDTSLGHERYVGWRHGICSPFFPYHRELRREIRTIQLPPAWMDSQLFLHASDNPGPRDEILRGLTDQVAKLGGCLVVNVHDYVFDAALYPGWGDAYARLLRYIESRGDIWVATSRAVADHWRQRAEAIESRSAGLGVRPSRRDAQLVADASDVGG